MLETSTNEQTLVQTNTEENVIPYTLCLPSDEKQQEDLSTIK
jgi:hypothetical protein